MANVGFIFGGNTGETYDSLQAKRRMADAMRLASLRQPSTFGQGLTSLGQALAAGIIGQRVDREDKKNSEAYREKANTMLARLMGGNLMGGGAPGFAGGSSGYVPDAEPSPTALPAGVGQTALGYGVATKMADTPAGPKPVAGDAIPPAPPIGSGAQLGFGDLGADPHWQAIQQGIFAGESGGDYDALYGYQNRPGGAFDGVRVSDMSIGDVIAFTDPSGPYAQSVKSQIGRVATPVGAYQVVGSTLRDAVQQMGLDPNMKFTPEVQDAIGKHIYATQGTGAWEGYQGPGGGGNASALGAQALPVIMELMNDPYATEGDVTVLNMLLQQSLRNMDPMTQLEIEKARLELEQMRRPERAEPIEVGGVLLDGETLQPLFDSRTPEGENLPDGFYGRHLTAVAGGLLPGTPEYEEFMLGSTKGNKYGLSVIWGRDAQGNAVPAQVSENGSIKLSEVPDGWTPDPGLNAQMQAEGRAIGTAAGEAAAAIPQSEGMVGIISGQINDLLGDPYLPRMLGPVDSRMPNVTSDAARVQAKMQQLQGGAFLQARQLLKGGGAITDFESTKAEQAFIRAQAAQTPEDYAKALRDFEDAIKVGLAKLRQTSNLTDPQPQPGELYYNPETGEFE